MMSAVQAIEDANKEIHHGELSNVLPVGSLGNTQLSMAMQHTSTLHMPCGLGQHQSHHHHHHHQPHQQQQHQTSQSSNNQQQQPQQPNHPQAVGNQLVHEPVSPHQPLQQVPLSPHHLSQQQTSMSPHHSLQQPPSQQLQQQRPLSTPHNIELENQHSVPSQTPSTSSSSLQLQSQGVNTAESSADIASSSQRAHLCTTCLKGFRSKQQLAQHSLVHSNIRKYTCSFCDHTFKQLSHLQQHTRIHTGEKPYTCKFEDCDRAFAQLSNLQHHMRNHEEQVKKEALRIYKCPICHRSYTNESSLKAHTLKMHVHVRNPEDQTPEGQPVKKRRKKKNKQLLSAPTMVPLEDGQSAVKKRLTETSSDDDVIIIGDKKEKITPDFGNIPRSLVESLNHYERTLAAGLTGKKLQDGNISSSNQSGAQQTVSNENELREIESGRSGTSLGLQGIMGLPGIDPALMTAQPPEIIERAAAAAAAAVSSQLLTTSHSLSQSSDPDNSSSSSVNNFQHHPQPAHSQQIDTHLRSQVTSTSLPTVSDQYYAHTGAHLGMLSPHVRFLSPARSMADLPLSYGSHIITAPPAATTSQLTLPAVHQTSSRTPSDVDSPRHVSEALNFNQ